MFDLIARLIAWVPGCSPDVPKTWRDAGLQAVTCLIRMLAVSALVYLLARAGLALL